MLLLLALLDAGKALGMAFVSFAELVDLYEAAESSDEAPTRRPIHVMRNRTKQLLDQSQGFRSQET